MSLPFHPYADLFPLIEGEAFDELVTDIDRNGLDDKIVLLDGMILDGRNRYRALVAADEINGFEGDAEAFPDYFRAFDPAREGDPLRWVLSRNLHRRHLTDRQRVMIAAEIAKLSKPGRPSQWRDPLPDTRPEDDEEPGQLAGLDGTSAPRSGPEADRFGDPGVPHDTNPANRPDSVRPVTQGEAAGLLHVPERQVRRGVQVLETGVPELIEAAKRGDIAPSAAEEIARLPVEEQKPRLEEAMKPRNARTVMASRTEPDDSLDFFPTPPWASRALVEDVLIWLDVGLAHSSVWEPACGEGHIAGVLQEYGASVISSDVFDYSADGRQPPGWAGAIDFLDPQRRQLGGFDWIITNPPFSPDSEKDIDDKALAFVLEALKHAAEGVAVFVRSQWAVEGIGRYEALFRDTPPTLMAFFSERVNLCKGRWDPKGGTATAYCWLVWLKDNHGLVEPRAPMWIPPGRRIERTHADDVERFTAHPVRALQPLSAAEESEDPEGLSFFPPADLSTGAPAAPSDETAGGADGVSSPAPSAPLAVRPKGLTPHQREAFDECLEHGLIRRRDGWAARADAFGHHSFQTVMSLIERGIFVRSADGKRAFVAPADIDQLIRDGYAGRLAGVAPGQLVAELADRTGLKPAAVKKRASRMGLGSRERQREGVRASTRRMHEAGVFKRRAGGTA